jgi:hypothetical protein
MGKDNQLPHAEPMTIFLRKRNWKLKDIEIWLKEIDVVVLTSWFMSQYN